MENRIGMDEIRSKVSQINAGTAEQPTESCRELCRQISPIDEDMIYGIQREILSRDPEMTTLQNLDVFMEDEALQKQSPLLNRNRRMNTYPFGEQTDEVYPRMLAVCRGEEKLDKVFRVMSTQVDRMAVEYPDPADKQRVGQGLSIFLITDKWNPSAFAKVEKKFLDYAIHHGIWFIFLLVTDYGFTQIPFLPNAREAMLDAYRNCEIYQEDGYKDLLRLQGDQEFSFRRFEGTWDLYNDITYTFDIENHRWKRESADGHFSEGEIPGKALGRFFQRVRFLANRRETVLSSVPMVIDAGTCSLKVLGHEVCWQDPVLEEPDNKQIQKIADAVNTFLQGCEDRRF